MNENLIFLALKGYIPYRITWDLITQSYDYYLYKIETHDVLFRYWGGINVGKFSRETYEISIMIDSCIIDWNEIPEDYIKGFIGLVNE